MVAVRPRIAQRIIAEVAAAQKVMIGRANHNYKMVQNLLSVSPTMKISANMS